MVTLVVWCSFQLWVPINHGSRRVRTSGNFKLGAVYMPLFGHAQCSIDMVYARFCVILFPTFVLEGLFCS